MKTVKMLSSLLIAIVALSSSAYSQVVILSGHVTGATGVFSSKYNTSSAVKLTLDFTPIPTAFYSTPHELRYMVDGSFTVGGDEVIVFPGDFKFVVSLHDSLLDQPGGEGLFIGQAWGGGAIQGAFLQYFLSQDDILSSNTLFPANIPFDKFSWTTGYYAQDSSGSFANRIDWMMTGYSGFAEGQTGNQPPPPPMSPVPEPSTYGITAALSLLGVAGFRRWRARWKPTPSKFLIGLAGSMPTRTTRI